MKTLVVGNGGRESSIAMKLAEESSVYAVMKHENPSIKGFVKKTGGTFVIGNPSDPHFVSRFAVENRIDLAFVSADDPLEAGIIDALLDEGIRAVGPTRAGAEIEWNKEYSMRLMGNIFPEFTPKFWVAKNFDEIREIFNEVASEGIQVVVKPQGLTAGKGVKVMGEHLDGYPAAERYAMEVLANHVGKSRCVIIVEKVEGIEFTVMAITDGKTVIPPPATYDHPFRFDGDKGPGTGGMGSFCDKRLPLPFMSQSDYDTSIRIIQGTVDALRKEGRHFNGVLNTGLFLTRDGLKFMEFNARFGDPECMNILSVLDSSLLCALEKIDSQRLSPKDIRFKRKASVVKYLVSPEYALSSGSTHMFELDVAAMATEGVDVFFSSSIAQPNKNQYSTVGVSRNVGLAFTADSITDASSHINHCITDHVKGPLHFRKDIGSEEELDFLKNKAQSMGRLSDNKWGGNL